MMRTSEVISGNKLNPAALERFNMTTSKMGNPYVSLDAGRDAINKDISDDLVNPLTVTLQTSRPKSRKQKTQGNRRGSSTFSSYYLNRQAKDLASLITIDDRDEFILEHDEFGGEAVDQVLTLPDKA